MEESGLPGMGEEFDDHADLAAGQAGKVMARVICISTGMECVGNARRGSDGDGMCVSEL